MKNTLKEVGEKISLAVIIKRLSSQEVRAYMKKIPSIAFQSEENKTEFELLKLSKISLLIEAGVDHNPAQAHRLTFFVLLIITEGTGSHMVDFKHYDIQAGMVLKIAKGQVHAFQQNMSCKGFLIPFTEDFILKYFSKSSLAFISHLYNYHISTPIVKNHSLNQQFISQLVKELENEDTYAKNNILAKLLELYLLQLERHSHQTISSKRDTRLYPLFIAFKNLVEENYIKSRNVKDYAQMMSISAKHLNVVVKTFTLNTAKHFIDQYVVLEIKRAIISTNNSLKEIAYEMGFEEVTNFTKFFKKHAGLTPKAFKTKL